MTGDGVNDVLALKDADCGIAMASGAEAACHAAQLVLLDSNFACLPQVVAEGRRVINNIQRSASLFLVKNIFSFILALFTLVVDMAYPFMPVQLSLISALTIGFPAFVLALEPSESLVRGRFLTNVLREAFPGGLTDLLLLLCIQFYAFMFGFPHESLSTMCTMCVAFVGVLVLYQVSKPLDWKRWLLLGTVVCALLICIKELGWFFYLTDLTIHETLIMALFLPLAWFIMRGMLGVFNRGEKIWNALGRIHRRGKRVRQEKKS